MKSRNMIKILCMASLSLTVLGGITCFGNRYAKAEETVPHNAENEWEDETLTWSLDANGTLTVTGSGNIYVYDWEDYDARHTDVKKIVLNITGADRLIIYEDNFPNVESLDLKGFDTSQITNLSYAFSDLKKLKTIEFGNFNTGNVTSMARMFSGCSSLTGLNLSGWNTGKVTDMYGMFSGCRQLSDLNLSGWNTSAVMDMGRMFFSCNNLKNLNISNFNTGKVTDMNNMFSGCVSLASLDLSRWNTEKVINMSCLFDGCYGLTSINLSGWNTGRVIQMDSMFSDCKSLTALDVTGFSTGSVTDMDYMFFSCNSLKEIDISNFDLSNIELDREYTGETYPISLFGNLDNLEKIKMPANLPERVRFPYSTITPDYMEEYWTDESGVECEYVKMGLSVPMTYTRVWARYTQTPPENNNITGDTTVEAPNAVSVSKLKAGSKKITVKWKKQSSISGYQVQISKNKKFKSGTIQRMLSAS